MRASVDNPVGQKPSLASPSRCAVHPPSLLQPSTSGPASDQPLPAASLSPVPPPSSSLVLQALHRTPSSPPPCPTVRRPPPPSLLQPNTSGPASIAACVMSTAFGSWFPVIRTCAAVGTSPYPVIARETLTGTCHAAQGVPHTRGPYERQHSHLRCIQSHHICGKEQSPTNPGRAHCTHAWRAPERMRQCMHGVPPSACDNACMCVPRQCMHGVPPSACVNACMCVWRFSHPHSFILVVPLKLRAAKGTITGFSGLPFLRASGCERHIS